MKQSSASPVRKVWAGALGSVSFGSALSIVLLYIIERATGEQLPTEVAGAVTVLVTTAAYAITAYFVPPAAEDAPVAETPPQP